MFYKNLPVLLLGTVAAVTQAELPYTFSANTPARAAEVNGNVHYLEDEIDQLKSADSDTSSGSDNTSGGDSNADTDGSGYVCANNTVDYDFTNDEVPVADDFSQEVSAIRNILNNIAIEKVQ